MNVSTDRPLRPGDVVEVRPAAEILATLDSNAAVDRMPFMPEMIRYAGQRFTVTRRVDKICDTIAQTGGRRMEATVYIGDLRCDGARHGGCQAGCLIYWKEAWLRRVDDAPRESASSRDVEAQLEHLVEAGTHVVRHDDGEPSEVWRCQATEAFDASKPMKVSSLPQYWRELTNGNFGLPRFVFLLMRGLIMEIASRFGLLRRLPLKGEGQQSRATDQLDLQRGDLVQVRPPSEIATTLDPGGLNRGLSFDREMLPYCGRTFRVREKVRQIIDDKTGRMLTIPKDCIILEGVVCSGERSPGCWFCPRQIYPFWRESWLRRVEKAERA